jgi:RNA polymerase sigma factor (sigma-70 family)
LKEEMMQEINELELRRAFNGFCRKVLRNEAINAQVASERRKNIILNFSDINFNEEVMAGSDTLSFDLDTEYAVKGRSISNAQLTEAINRLAAPYKKVIELYYFYQINDRLISELMQIPRSTVQSWRTKALNWLRKDLEESSDECDAEI